MAQFISPRIGFNQPIRVAKQELNEHISNGCCGALIQDVRSKALDNMAETNMAVLEETATPYNLISPTRGSLALCNGHIIPGRFGPGKYLK